MGRGGGDSATLDRLWIEKKNEQINNLLKKNLIEGGQKKLKYIEN